MRNSLEKGQQKKLVIRCNDLHRGLVFGGSFATSLQLALVCYKKLQTPRRQISLEEETEKENTIINNLSSVGIDLQLADS